jgi:hypothetical protein
MIRRLHQSKILFWTLLIIVQVGCASLPETGFSQQKTADLTQQLIELGEEVDKREAAKLAEVAVAEAIHLAHDYKSVRPAWFHNVLVNRGLKARGLCFEWANDLFLRLHQLGLKTIDLHLIVSRMDNPHEHNAIVATAHGQPFSTGIVIDGWRHSGRLWTGPVLTDKKYHWELLPDDRIDPEVKKSLSNGQLLK